MDKAAGREHFESRLPSVTGARSAIYLFCLACPQVAAGFQAPDGDERNPVSCWTFRDLTAVISKVKLEDFCGPAANRRLEDLAWVAPRACRHEAVVERAMRFSPVLPARFGTLFSSLENLEAFLKSHQAGIRRFLRRMILKEEWAVQAMLDRRKASEQILSAILRRQKKGLSRLPAGMRYFQQQRMRAEVEEELRGWLKKTCEEAVSDFSRQAAEVRRRPVLPPAANEENEMILNCAFLVPANAAAGLRRRIRRINCTTARRGLVFRLSGPWPPYSFSSSLLRPAEA